MSDPYLHRVKVIESPDGSLFQTSRSPRLSSDKYKAISSPRPE